MKNYKPSKEFVFSVFLIFSSFLILQNLIIPDIANKNLTANTSNYSKSPVVVSKNTKSNSVSNFCDKVYMSGGHSASYYNDFYGFDIDNGWQTLFPEAPFGGRGYPVFLTFQDKVWVIGGRGNNGHLNDVWSFDGISWTQFDHDLNTDGIQNAPWPARAHFTGVVFDGKIWIFGGGQNGVGYNDVWSFDGVSWTQFDHDLNTDGIQNAPWSARNGHKVVVFEDKIWMFSKISGDNLNDVWSFDGVSWTQFDHDLNTGGIQGPPMTTSHWEPILNVFNNKIWLMGGWNGVGSNEVWSFDGISWTQFDHDLNTDGIQNAPWSPRWEFADVLYDDKLWIMAGSSPFKNDVWSFDGISWTQFDHDLNTDGIQNAPWPARDGLMALYVDCDEVDFEESEPDILITKEVDEVQNGQATYEISISNVGNVPVTNIQAFDQLPPGVSYVSHTNPPGTSLEILPGGNISIGSASMGIGETLYFTVTVNVEVGSCDYFVNTINVSMDEEDVNMDNNTSSAELRVGEGVVGKTRLNDFDRTITPCISDFSVSKTVKKKAKDGKTISYEITVSNLGPNTRNFTLEDQLSPYFDYVFGYSSNPNIELLYDSNYHSVSSNGPLNVGDSITFILTVYINNSIPKGVIGILNTANVSGVNTIDSNLTNNSSSVLVENPKNTNKVPFLGLLDNI